MARRAAAIIAVINAAIYWRDVDFVATKSVFAALERERVVYAVFGAAALNLHGLARFTEDS